VKERFMDPFNGPAVLTKHTQCPCYYCYDVQLSGTAAHTHKITLAWRHRYIEHNSTSMHNNKC